MGEDWVQLHPCQRRAFRAHRLLALLVLVVACFAAPVAAQSADQSNAATWYQRALDRLRSLTEAQREMLYNVDTSQGMANTPPEYRELIVELRPMLDLARRGSVQQFSDFGLDHSQGFELQLPHISEMRNLARVMHADARLRLESGDTSGAAEALATMYRMSDHFGDDRVVISSLVGQAINNYADSLTYEAIDAGKFNASDAMTLLKASMRMSPTDPFGYADAVMGEQELMLATVKDAIESDDPNRNINDMASILNGEEVPVELLGMDKDALSVDIEQLDSLMNSVVGAFLSDDRQTGQAQLDELMREVENGEHGFFAQIMMPSMSKVYERMIESEEAVEKRVRALREIATGEVTPGEAANAALWYLRGIEMLNQLSPETLARIRAAAASPDEIDEDTAAALTSAAQIIAMFSEASFLRRCDFSFARDFDRERLKRDYAAGMLDGARLLHADAVRLAKNGSTAQAMQWLAVCIRMSWHLGEDKAIISSLTAHAIFTRTAALFDTLRANPAESEHDAIIRAAIDRVSRKDPFGFVAAIKSDRALALKWMYEHGAVEPKNEGDMFPSPQKLAERCEPDQLISLLMLIDWLLNPSVGEPGDPAFDFTPLADVLALDRVAAIHATARDIARRHGSTAVTGEPHPPDLAERTRAIITEGMSAVLPTVAPVNENMNAARQTVRDLERKVRAEAVTASDAQSEPVVGESIDDTRAPEPTPGTPSSRSINE